MKAIPTWHDGTQFRSRLEAKWAVFFSHLGIPWEYEPEVKPPHAPDEGEAFYETLLRRISGMDKLLILVGVPRVVWYPVYTVEPSALLWIDLDRSSTERRPHYRFTGPCPPREDLAWPHLRFERACMAAAAATFGPRRVA
jgi:hypothetical protein